MDDDDFEYDDYDDELDGAQDFDDEGNETEADEPAEEDEGNGEAENDEDEQEQELNEQQQEQIEAMKKNLAKIKNSLKTRFWPVILPNEMLTINRAKKMGLKKEVDEIERIKKARKQRKNAGGILGGSTTLVGLGTFALIVLLVLLAAQLVQNMFPWQFGGSGTGPASVNGITGADFYGLRAIYRDETLAKRELTENYEITIEEIATALENDANLNISAVILLPAGKTVPGQGYNFDNFATDYAGTNLFKLTDILATAVYVADSGAEYDSALLLPFDEKLAGVKYFGFSEAIVQQAAEKIANYLCLADNNALTLDETEDDTPPTVDEATVKANIDNYFASHTARAEMLFVKDFILSGEEDMVVMSAEDVEKDYVAMIFMPKKNVKFYTISFSISGVKEIGNLTVTVLGADNVTLTPSLFLEDALEYGEADRPLEHTYSVEYTGEITASAFADIDAGNLNALAQGVSLFRILKLNNFNTFLQLNDEGGYYTAKLNGVGVGFNFKANEDGSSTAEPFTTGEMVTEWQ